MSQKSARRAWRWLKNAWTRFTAWLRQDELNAQFPERDRFRYRPQVESLESRMSPGSALSLLGLPLAGIGADLLRKDALVSTFNDELSQVSVAAKPTKEKAYEDKRRDAEDNTKVSPYQAAPVVKSQWRAADGQANGRKSSASQQPFWAPWFPDDSLLQSLPSDLLQPSQGTGKGKRPALPDPGSTDRGSPTGGPTGESLLGRGVRARGPGGAPGLVDGSPRGSSGGQALMEAMAAGAESGTLPGSGTATATVGSPEAELLDPVVEAALAQKYGQLPMRFELNKGQTDGQVKFQSRGPGYNLFLTSGEAVLVLQKPSEASPQPADPRARPLPGEAQAPPPEFDVVRMKFEGANLDAKVVGVERLPGNSNYFVGNDPDKWVTDIPNYARVMYKDLYPGIDLVYYGTNQQQLEYDLVVKPGADPSAIRLDFDGAKELRVDAQGNLIVGTEGGDVMLKAPILYQQVEGTKLAVAGGFVLEGSKVSFAVGTYDPSKSLVIDPVLSYSTYLGGSGYDQGLAIAVDEQGSAYVTGYTYSGDFPTQDPFQDEPYSVSAFVAKLNPAGDGLAYSTYLGGPGAAYGIAVDGDGCAYITGDGAIPTTQGAFQTSGNGESDAFVTKLGSLGNVLVYSTYLGGSDWDWGTAIAVDDAGSAYVTGITDSDDFPTQDPLDSTEAGRDAFVTKLNASGSALVYSTYLGGNTRDQAEGIAVDGSGNVYVAGWTAGNFPTVDAVQPEFGGGEYDAFVSAISATGAELIYSTYLGGIGHDDRAAGIAVDLSGSAYVTGWTDSEDFPTANAFQSTLDPASGFDAFLTKLDADGQFAYSTYLGGNEFDAGTGVAVDGTGNPYVTGWTYGYFPLVDPIQPEVEGQYTDAFVAKMNASGSALLYASYLGGSDIDEGAGIALDVAHNVYVVGNTFSSDFPTVNPFQEEQAGIPDAFVAKMIVPPAPPTIDSITSDSGASSSDRLTNDQTLILSGTAEPNATVTISREGVGVIGSVTANSAGNWTFDYTGTTLPEGEHAFTATASFGSNTSEPSAPVQVVVDLTPPAVTLLVDDPTSDLTPSVRIVAEDANGLPNGTPVLIDVDLDDSGTFGSGELGYVSGALHDGQAVIEVTPALALGTYRMRARVTDQAGNEGQSDVKYVDIVTVTNPWDTTADHVTNEECGCAAMAQTGNVHVEAHLDLDNSPGRCACQDAKLVYNSERVDVKPVVQVQIQTDNVGTKPPIQVQLTWDGQVVATTTIPASAYTAGELLTVGLQVPTKVEETGRYLWSVQVTMDFPGTEPDVVQTVNGKAFVVVAEDTPTDSNPLGAGWSFGMTDRLVLIPAQGSEPEGMLRVKGNGGYSFYEKVDETYVSEPGDSGTLVKNPDGTFVYTSRHQEKYHFNAAGMLTKYESGDGHYVTDYTYTDADNDGKADDLATMTTHDGAVTTFNYESGRLLSVVTGARTVALAHSGSDLTQITSPDSSVRTFAYNADHKLTSDTVAGVTTAYTYGSSGAVSSITTGSGGATLVTPAAGQGLGTAIAGPAWAVFTDALGNQTRMLLDAAGRLLQQIAPDGGLWTWTRDANGWVTAITDPLGRVTSYVLNSLGLVTQETLPDGSTRSYEYNHPFNLVTRFVNELGQATTFAYDALGHLLSTTNALNQTTTYAWTDNLLTSVTDAANRTTQFVYDAADRLIKIIDALLGETEFTYDDNGNLASIEDQLGRITSFVNDALGRVLQMTNAAGKVWTWAYNAVGQLTEATDPLGNVTQYLYNDQGLLEKIKEAFGAAEQRTTEFIYNAAGQLIRTLDPRGKETEYKYDPAGRVEKIINELDGVQKFKYDLAGQLTKQVDALGRATKYTYYARGWLATLTNAKDEVTSFGYDATGNLVNLIDPLGRVTNLSYDALGRPTQVKEGAGLPQERITTIAYDAVDNVSSITDALGRVTEFVYDELNRLLSMTEAAGTTLARTSTFVYDAVSNLTRTTDPLGLITDYTYNNLDQLTAVTEGVGTALQRATSFAYDDAGRLVSTTNHLGVVTQFVYDAFYRRTQVTEAVGTSLERTTTTAYDANNNVTSITDPLGNVTTFSYDALNRLTEARDALGHRTYLGYDLVGNVTAFTNALGHTSRYFYDKLNREIQRTDALGGIVSTVYNAVGEVTSFTDPANNTTTYGYDPLGRVVLETDPLGASSTYQYDLLGNLTSMTDRNGRKRDFTYDALNRQTAEIWRDAGGAAIRTITKTYNARDELLSISDPDSSYTYTRDLLGRATSISNAGTPGAPTVVLNQTFDVADRRTSVSATVNGVADYTNNYQYDLLGRMTRIEQSGTGVAEKRIDLAYDDRDQFASITRYADLAGTQLVATSNFTYDNVGQLTALSHVQGATPLAEYTWTYDAAGRITKATSPDGISLYNHDLTDQLTAADHDFQADEGYPWDLNGNPSGTGYVIGPGNRLVSDGTYQYQYDAEGNRTRRTNIQTGEVREYEWDYRNRLTRFVDRDASGNLIREANYTYDVFNRRIAKTVDWDGAGLQLAETQGFVYDGFHIALVFTGAGSLTNRFVYGPIPNQILADEKVTVPGLPGTVYWPLTDQVGSARDWVDSTGAVVKHVRYDSFGKIIYDSNPSLKFHQGYTGAFQDSESDQLYAWHRYLQFGRWLSEDWVDADSNPNRYVENDPLIHVDPTGLAPPDKHFGLPEDFWRWYHRQIKQKGDPNLERSEAEEWHEQWKRQGRPNAEGHRTDEAMECSLPRLLMEGGELWVLYKGRRIPYREYQFPHPEDLHLPRYRILEDGSGIQFDPDSVLDFYLRPRSSPYLPGSPMGSGPGMYERGLPGYGSYPGLFPGLPPLRRPSVFESCPKVVREHPVETGATGASLLIIMERLLKGASSSPKQPAPAFPMLFIMPRPFWLDGYEPQDPFNPPIG